MANQPQQIGPAYMGLTPQQRIALFRANTRKLNQPLNVNFGSTYSAGGNWQIDLPPVGHLSAINLRVTGAVNFGASGALGVRGPWDLLKNIQLVTNGGVAEIVDISGYGLFTKNCLDAGFNPADSDIYAAATASGDNTWDLRYRIPVSLNDRDEFWVGLMNLQTRNLQVTLKGTWADLTASGADIATLDSGTGPAATVKLTAEYEYYEVGNPARIPQPGVPIPGLGYAIPPMYHRLLETRQTITAAGEQTVTLPQQGNLLRLIHTIIQNDAAVTYAGADTFRLLVNYQTELVRKSGWNMRYDMARTYLKALASHVFVHDFYNANAVPGMGDGRDVIPAQDISLVQSLMTLASAPSGTLNQIYTLRELTQQAG
jgi:hypothetical protein